MRLREFVESKADAQTLAALATFLADRADDEAASKQISKTAFIELAQSMGVNVTDQNISDLVSAVPLSNILNPIDPGSDIVSFKGDTEAATGMSVDQAQEVVNSNAKAAMKRRQAKEDAALTADQKKRIERNRAAALEKLAQKGAGGQIV